ncbi:fibronectin type III domain-containing protein [Frigoriflavimonas asaccharolytica]|uniref:Fibronectin type-III domain-containing protein n=1 Tax=Frigoriflavimonas asaccharolytica TaxID=2735899 RepID=A0A8J8K8T5_9FLAO|nr:fibronectin type III domain-containing protein [Frigoriflavimonas asaccharolytica]NRS92297.1 hypothetical protein [Frigoriflavimonas asaccharolytica]
MLTSFGLGSLNAQVSGYVFSQANGSYSSIGGTVLGNATSNSTVTSLYLTSFPVTMPFVFKFNGQSYTNLNMSSNGYVSFGTGSATGTSPISATTTYDGAIAAWGRSINSIYDILGKSGNMSWTVEGTAPNRVAVFQWENFRPSYTTSTSQVYVFSFQIRLAESTNVISTVYSSGNYLIGGTTTYSGTGTQIGLRGFTNSDFNNRLTASTAVFGNSTPGTANSSGQSFNTVTSTPGMPADGLTYIWTPPTCFGPTGIAVSNITTNSADLAWTTSSSTPTNGYDVYYSTTNTAPNGTTTPNHTSVMGSSQALSGLSPSTTYYVWVRSVCSASDTSSWIALPNFNTLCAPLNYMYENFDSTITGSVVPNCWVRLAGTGTQSITTTSPVSAPNNLYQNSTSTTNQTIVVLPEFSNINAGTHWLRLKARVGVAPRVIEFGYVTNANDASTFVLIESKNINNIVYTSNDSEYTIIVPSTIPANARLAIKNPGTTSTALYYDDVYWEPIPSCMPPSAPTVSNITSASADIAWVASTTTPANGYEVYYTTTSVAPTASTTPNHTNVTGLSQSLSGLIPATEYFVWIRSKCSSSDSSTWVAVQSFNTACLSVTSMYENFDTTPTGSVVPSCWDRIVSGAGSQTISTTSPNSSPNNVYAFSSSSANQVILVLPVFSNINAGTHWLRLKARVSTGPRTIEFGYVTNVTDANSFVLLTTKTMSNITYSSIDSEYTIIVPNTVPANARLAIKNSGSASTALYIDDVYWEVAPTCFPPDVVTPSGAGSTTATISWTAAIPVPTNGYEIYYSTNNTPPTAATIPNVTGIVGNSTTISGLNPVSTYFVWVRSACSTIDKSTWSNVASFTTSCQPPALLTTTGATVCPNGTATLSATADPGATIQWYDGAGTLLSTGNSFTSPALTTTTTYFATAAIGSNNLPAGKANYGSGPTSGSGTTNFGLVFDVISPSTLTSVTIYPVSATNTAGTVIIDIIDGNGNILQSKTENVTGSPAGTPVAHVATLNFSLLPGTNYKIRPRSYTGITGLLFDPSATAPSGNYGYPFVLPGILTINSSTLTATPTNTARTDLYYYFYDWKVSSQCESAQQSVVATVDAACLSTSEVTKNDVKIYPNPFTDVINISDVRGLASITVNDVSGRLIKTILKPNEKIFLGELKSGMYLLTLKYQNGQTKTIKAIKK